MTTVFSPWTQRRLNSHVKKKVELRFSATKKNVNCAVLSVFDFQYSEVHVDFRSARSFIGIVLFVISGAVCDLTHCALKYLECLSISLYQKHGCIFHLFFPLGILRFSQRYITTVIILSFKISSEDLFCLYREVSHFNLTYGFIL